MKRKLYFVGDDRSLKTRQWLAVTPYREEADRLRQEIPGAVAVFNTEELKHRRRKS